MADKVQLIKEEIEKKRQLIWPTNTGEMKVVDTPNQLIQGWLNCLKWIEDFINSLQGEPASDDLDKLVISLEETIGTSPHSREAIKEHLQKAAEWQKEKDKQLVGATQKISHQHGYDEGRADMREEMMKDAVEAFVNTYENTDDSNYVEFVTEQSPYKFKETEKCKLIIIKEEQQ